jgi:peptidoglycan/LPS O-acetylase OafA/YrhL
VSHQFALNRLRFLAKRLLRIWPGLAVVTLPSGALAGTGTFRTGFHIYAFPVQQTGQGHKETYHRTASYRLSQG